jgi:D-serine deaminase-like pyridoxal phosphate-dependent protein
MINLKTMQKLHDLPTPCLVLDLDRFESNVETMARFIEGHPVALRPHAKTHKCVEVARRQLARGAVGISVATIAEAEVMAAAGIRGLLITSEMVGEPKVSRLIHLISDHPDTMTVVDDPENVRELQSAAQKAGIRLTVLIDLDIGQNRTGTQPGEPALLLAEEISRGRNLMLKGICAYAGHAAHVAGFQERQAASKRALERAVETHDLLRRKGHSVEILSGGSSGTYNIDPLIEGVTEIQAGSYVFMDVEYRRIHRDFEPALSVLATVIHRSREKTIVDAGLKAFATDRAFGPEPLDVKGVTYAFAGDEHGSLTLENPDREVRLGEKLRFIPPHCDPNVNLYDRIYCARGENVEGFWPIMQRASGAPYF